MRNFKYSIALDVDDVLMPCASLMVKKMKELYNIDITKENIENKDTISKDVLDKIQNLFLQREFYEEQVPYEGAVEFVKKISKKMEIFIVTAIPGIAMDIRVKQIKKFFPEINENNIIPAKRKDIIHTDFSLDDSSKNILSSIATYPVLFRRPWNKNITGVLAVNNYNEFLNIFDNIVTNLTNSYIKFTKPTIIALVGPSGAGKTAILNELIKTGKVESPISVTTRRKRDEKDNYEFVTKEEFVKMKERGEFLETTYYAGEYYGTKKESVTKILEEGKHVVIAIDIAGALNLRKDFKTVLFYVKRDKRFLIESLTDRLLIGKIQKENFVNRLCSIDMEKRNKDLCDYVIDNNKDIKEVIKNLNKTIKL